jgi:RHS repeat-associated protein
MNYYSVDTLTYSDYYPFGMLMPNRHGQDEYYRYAFNGAEKDDEIRNTKGASYDLGARMYDPRIGRMLSSDPWEYKYAWQSSYAYFKNSPISQIDWKGFGDPPKKKEIKKGDTYNKLTKASNGAYSVNDLKKVESWC